MMNIFYLDENLTLSAQGLCDKHVNKMILETAQLLCTAHRELDGNERADRLCLYKSTHVNHPCAVWVRASELRYNFAYVLLSNLLDEFEFRYGKVHKTKGLLGGLVVSPRNIYASTGFDGPPLCMPDQYKQANAVEAYRAYYKYEKANQPWAKWERGRAKPEWL